MKPIPVVLASVLAGCTPALSDPRPVPPADGGGVPLSSDACGIGCWRIRRVGCREGKPFACERACKRLVESEIPPDFECLDGADTVDAVRACGLRCLP